jgi:hypothetical protein
MLGYIGIPVDIWGVKSATRGWQFGRGTGRLHCKMTKALSNNEGIESASRENIIEKADKEKDDHVNYPPVDVVVLYIQ